MEVEAAAAGLIAGTVPTKGHGGKGRAQIRQHQGRGRVAGDDDGVGRERIDQPADDRDDAGDQRRLRPGPVGKAGIIRRIDERRVRPRGRDFGQDGESAEAGIEHENLGS